MGDFFAEKAEQVYITKSNYQRMLNQFDLKKLPEFQGDIYKTPIYFFSKFEKKHLLVIQFLLKDPENFVGLYYNPIEREDTFTYVYEAGQPAYHRRAECPKLTSSFKNFEIPIEIRDKGTNEVVKFRRWFDNHREVFENDTNKFTELLQANFRIQIHPKAIDQGNSGSKGIKNYSLSELESEIDKLIKEAGRCYYASDRNKAILKRFSTLTFLAYKEDEIKNNDTGYSDDIVKDLLKYYDREYKKPLKSLLLEYYKIIHNPKLSFSGMLLERLGFKSCGVCENGILQHEIDAIENKIKESILPDDLPF